MDWLSQNLATIIISMLILLVVFFIIRYLIRQNKKGKSACGCGCNGCSLASGCGQVNHKKSS